MKVYNKHNYLLHISASHVAILREVGYKVGHIEILQTFVISYVHLLVSLQYLIAH
jgi:hypothetical protein